MGVVEVAGVRFDAVTEEEAVERVRGALGRGEGGRIFTPNVDILRQDHRPYLRDATLVVADGMPIVWASRLAGTPLPERVAGSNLILSLARGLAGDGRSMYLLGGVPAVPGRSSGAERAALRLRADCRGLRVSGVSPPFGFVADARLFETVRDRIVAYRPDLVCVGIGFPRQEVVINRLRRLLPGTWFLGCGGAVNFLAGDQRRAPGWMQRRGLEWLHRLGREPTRLADRYLRHDAPYAARMLANAAARRYFRRE